MCQTTVSLCMTVCDCVTFAVDVVAQDKPLSRGVLYLAGEKFKKWMQAAKADDCDDALAATISEEDKDVIAAYRMRTEMREMKEAMNLLAREVRDDHQGSTPATRGNGANRGRGAPPRDAVVDRMYSMLDDFCDKTKQARGSVALAPEEIDYLENIGSSLESSLGKISNVTLFPASQTGNGWPTSPSRALPNQPREIKAQKPLIEPHDAVSQNRQNRSNSSIEDAMHNIITHTNPITQGTQGERGTDGVIPPSNDAFFSRPPPARPTSFDSASGAEQKNRIKHI